MKTNESFADRVIRIIIGLVLLASGIYEIGLSMVFGVILIIIGAIVLVTGITGFCALYSILGISTCKNCNTSEHKTTKN
jgi:uncharacterized membrane protein